MPISLPPRSAGGVVRRRPGRLGSRSGRLRDRGMTTDYVKPTPTDTGKVYVSFAKAASPP
jgi:hypothetical protein